ncbi:sodium:solute symporter [Thalassotalea maritima]|uniref:sodium:solute symporter n=1 Tax=Thalassotalea maritima TaxID=3242416 RepID=UPI003527A377
MNNLTIKALAFILLFNWAGLSFANTEIQWLSQPLSAPLSSDSVIAHHNNKTFLVSPSSKTLSIIENGQVSIHDFPIETTATNLTILSYRQFNVVIHHDKTSNHIPTLTLIKWFDNGSPSYQAIDVIAKAFAVEHATIFDNRLWVLTNKQILSLDLQRAINGQNTSWQQHSTLPESLTQSGLLSTQNDGSGKKLYLFDRIVQQVNDKLYVPFWSLSATSWQQHQRANEPSVSSHAMINEIYPLGQSHLLATTTDNQFLSFNTITQQWTVYRSSIDASDLQGLTFHNNRAWAINKQGRLVSGSLTPPKKEFGVVNMSVLVVYLLLMVAVGLYFVFKNKSTDDYFRGGQSIPWWAAACSIYATMLSSLTYVALPAVVYQTNWVLLLGIWTIILVAPLAIYVAMPFFRQIDATSAYEYLSKRFNMSVRLFASGLFTLFHIGRMGIVMALTALALSAVTPLSATESVLLMGVLCLLYCTLGGIEAVIWTDTIQTIVLLIGALACFAVILVNLDGGFAEFISIGQMNDKFTMANLNFGDGSITELALWVIILGGIGQNLSSYTADQAVVQRYTVTKNPKAAAKSIWTNAIIAGPGALLFFCLGTGLYAFYHAQPEKLDPTIQIDQIFPTFIASELPIGLAGLIVAGIFAAAQSTVSTSMNSIATTVVTDFIRPFNVIKTEQGYMRSARWLTFTMGTLGTLAGLIFINPEIRSLMEAYFKVIGMFMGALGGLFVLGALSARANAQGALIGIVSGVVVMISAWQLGWANGYLYASIGIVSCLVIGYLASLAFSPSNKDLSGLTLFTMKKSPVYNQ